MNPTIQKAIDSLYAAKAKTERSIKLLESLANVKFPELTGAFVYEKYNGWDKPTTPEVTLILVKSEDGVVATKAAMSALGIHKVNKCFNASTGGLNYKGSNEGVALDVCCERPTRCRVKAVVEAVEIPEKVVPAHTETCTRYVIENPEECGTVGALEPEPEEF